LGWPSYAEAKLETGRARTGISQAKRKQKFTAADLGDDLIAKVVYTVGLYPPKLLRLLPLPTSFEGFILKPGAVQPGEDLAWRVAWPAREILPFA